MGVSGVVWCGRWVEKQHDGRGRCDRRRWRRWKSRAKGSGGGRREQRGRWWKSWAEGKCGGGSCEQREAASEGRHNTGKGPLLLQRPPPNLVGASSLPLSPTLTTQMLREIESELRMGAGAAAVTIGREERGKLNLTFPSLI
ncbi:hypothetical protein [Oryza sativa Japonica Group]|uniref:Uncharacterized protein P0694A04.33 n=1 Tax=Oryza sativa subsp. japonica TaxID=39947 RepID=Q5SMZ4_ORYSJ|nr:hypothetical protein [Oryza sativa Japonica Group]